MCVKGSTEFWNKSYFISFLNLFCNYSSKTLPGKEGKKNLSVYSGVGVKDIAFGQRISELPVSMVEWEAMI